MEQIHNGNRNGGRLVNSSGRKGVIVKETVLQKTERLKKEYERALEIYGREFEAEAGPESSTCRVLLAVLSWAGRFTAAVTEPARIAHQNARDRAQAKYDAAVAPYKQAYMNALVKR